jgi:hypothetical protein
MDTKFQTFCDIDGFKNNVYWGGVTPYKNTNWFDVELVRGKSDLFQDIDENQLQDRVITYQRVRMEQFFSLPLRSYLVDYFSRLGTNDTVEMTILETAQKFVLTNLRFEDNGDAADIVSSCKMTFDLTSVNARDCEQTDYEVAPC